MPDAKRAQNVCQTCVLRKKACDKALPACGFCARRGLRCRYDTAAQKKNVSIQDVIIENYFTGFHTSFPVVSPDSFCQEASRYRQEGCSPPADFTVLLLALLMIISPPLSSPILLPGITQELLHATTKVAFSQAQTSITTSLRLIQAGVLITLREYTGTRADAAYVSLMSCVGMARISGIVTATIRRTSEWGTAGDLGVDTLEKENAAWAIAMLERLTLCEIGQPNITAQTEYPGPEYMLPSDLKPTTAFDYRSNPHLKKLHSATLLTPDLTAVECFGQQTQVTSLFDRLLAAMRHIGADTEAELAALDGEIQHFLKTVLSEAGWKRKMFCVPAAMCVRLLLLLHGSVVDTQPADCQREGIALMGLKTACRIVLDVLECGKDDPGLVMPICCFYSIREARRRVQGRKGFPTDQRLAGEVDTLLRAERQYRKTWAF